MAESPLFEIYRPSPSGMVGFRVYEIPIPRRVVQAKCHRKRRINQKWLRRYGFKTVVAPYDPLCMLQVGNNIYAYPEGIKKLKEHIAAIPVRGFVGEVSHA